MQVKIFTYKKIKNIYFKAFSLVEIIVVLGLFSSVATLALGTIFNAQTINSRLQSTQAILDNVNLSSQTIARDIRFGFDFYCSSILPVTIPSVRKNCTFSNGVPGAVLIFTPADASSTLDRAAYYLDNGVLYKNSYPYGGVTTTEQMTTDDVIIKNLIFYVDGANTSDGSNDYNGEMDYKQPLVSMLFSGYARDVRANTSSTTFNFQLDISARELDIQ